FQVRSGRQAQTATHANACGSKSAPTGRYSKAQDGSPGGRCSVNLESLGDGTKMKPGQSVKTESLLTPREAALQLRISFPTIKQWIYKKKIRSVRTPGGHHRIPRTEVDR